MEQIRTRKSPDRATLQVETLVAINPLEEQLKEEFKDMVRIKRDDVVNFILSLRSEPFSEKELDKIRKEKLTDQQRAKWLLKQVQIAESAGKDVNLDALMEQIKGSERPSRRTKKKPSSLSKQGDFRESEASKL